MRHALVILGLLSAIVLAPADLRANPLDAFGWGARASGLAGAATAVVDDFAANYYNPGALASDDRIRVDIGYSLVEPSLRLNDQDLDVDQSRGLHGGVTLPGRILDHVVAFSVGIFLPDDRISRIRALPQGQPRFVLFDNRPQRLVVTTSLAVEVMNDLFVGAGLTYVANTKGALEMEGLISASDAEDTELQTAVDVALESVRYVSAGILWTPGDHWRFGVTFRDEFSLDLQLDVQVAGTILLGNIELDEGTLDVVALDHNLFSPRQLWFGVAREAERWLVSFDFGWLQWSHFKPPTAEIRLELNLSALDFAIPVPDTPLDPGFHDIFVARVGGELVAVDTEHFDLTTRAGYFYEPSPAPNQPGITNYFDSDKHGVTVGASFAIEDLTEVLPGPLSLDISGLLIALERRDVAKDDPADPVGPYYGDGFLAGFTSTLRIIF